MDSAGTPSTSAMVPLPAVSIEPSVVVPEIAALPVAGLFAGRLRWSVRLLNPDQSREAEKS